jgi:CubicO group peptidase (beta-lactamase class C family)
MSRTIMFVLLAACGHTAEEADFATASPEDEGYSSQQLAQVTAYAQTIHSPAGVIVVGGREIWTWGDTSVPLDVHSIRKSILDVLYGPAVASSTIDLSTTLATLGINDTPPSLTATEQSATIQDLLESRSGVYHAALGSTPEQIADTPARGSHLPGTFWFYNNWDFNTLGVIYNQLTSSDLYVDFDSELAGPLGMVDWQASDGQYETDPSVSLMPYYDFQLSTRDMARFGLMVLQHGTWNGKQLAPADWLATSTQAYSQTGPAGQGYGYLWWIDETGTGLFNGVDLGSGAFAAEGLGGHYIVVIPSHDMVVVSRADDAYYNADPTDNNIGSNREGTLLATIFAAQQ